MGSMFATVLGFLTRYATEIDAVSTVLNSILDALPIQQQDRDNIKAELDKIANAGNSVRDFITNKAADVAPTPINIDAADIDKAVGDYLTQHIGSADALVKSVVDAMVAQHLVVQVGPAPSSAATETGAAADQQQNG